MWELELIEQVDRDVQCYALADRRLISQERFNDGVSVMVARTMEPRCSKSLWPCHWHSASVLPQQPQSDEHNLSIARVVFDSVPNAAKAPPPHPQPSAH